MMGEEQLYFTSLLNSELLIWPFLSMNLSLWNLSMYFLHHGQDLIRERMMFSALIYSCVVLPIMVSCTSIIKDSDQGKHWKIFRALI